MIFQPRIGLVAPSIDILGGQSVQARVLWRALRREGWDITFIPINPTFPPRLAWLRRIPYARTVVNEALYTLRLAALREVDVVHIFTASYLSFLLVCAPAIAAAKLFGKRVIVNYHSGEADDHLSRYGALVHPWLRLADEIVVPSEYLRGVFARHGYATRVVANVVELDQFPFHERDKLRPRLLSNRNLEPHYRVEDVIRAHTRLLDRHPDAQLVVAGTGSEGERMRALAAPAGSSVRFVGRVEPAGMPDLYHQSDVFVNASVIDNQPLSVLEAFAAGVPVVSTATGDLASMVRDGETGLIVPPRDPAALAAAVESLLADPVRAQVMSRRARDEVQKHRWQAVGSRWKEVYTP